MKFIFFKSFIHEKICSQVYRSVLLNTRQRHTSGSSDGSRAEASGSSSPVNVDKEEGKEKSKCSMLQ